MKLRCQEGDLAIVTGPGPFQDRIVKVTVLDPHPCDGSPAWLYEGPALVTPTGLIQISFYDCVLRPLRGAPGRDETLEWARVGETDYAHG